VLVLPSRQRGIVAVPGRRPFHHFSASSVSCALLPARLSAEIPAGSRGPSYSALRPVVLGDSLGPSLRDGGDAFRAALASASFAAAAAAAAFSPQPLTRRCLCGSG